MRQASKRIPDSAEKTVRDIRRASRRHIEENAVFGNVSDEVRRQVAQHAYGPGARATAPWPCGGSSATKMLAISVL